MQIHVQTPAASLIVDPFHTERFGSFMAAVKATLLHPKVMERIEKIERVMLEHDQMDCPVIHRFGPGVYIREITMPAGAFVVGAHHKEEHLNVMLKGRVTVLNENGTTTELVAPMVFLGKPGKKVGYVHEEVVWQNIYATDETDVEALEARYVIKGTAWETDNDKRCPSLQDEFDRNDYWRMLNQYGIPHDVARAQSENSTDLMPFPHGGYKVMVTDSTIEGRGLFATAAIEVGEVIAPARIGDKRTPAGRYTNHSACPNAEFVLLPNGDLNLVALRPISGMKGGRPGEEITIDYRQALEIRKRLCHQQSQQ